MTRSKKSLSDMIKTEVKSGAESQESAISLIPDSPIAESSPAVVQINTTDSNQSESKLIELNTDLEAANERANTLQNKVIGLEKELKSQQTLVTKLETKLEEANQFQDDLEAQKKLVKKLSAELETAQALKTELEEQKELIKKLYSELQKTEAVEGELAEQKQLVENLYGQLQEVQANYTQAIESVSPPVQEKALVVKKTPSYITQSRRPMGRYIASNKSASELSNDDIGWFD